MGKNKKDIPRVLSELNMVFTENVSYEVFDKFIGDICKDLDKEYQHSIYCMGNTVMNKCYQEQQIGEKAFDYKIPVDLLSERLSYILMFYYWSKSKEIFDFDKDFFEELTKTPITEIPIDKMKDLPYNTFVCQYGNNYIIAHKSRDLSVNRITSALLDAEFIYLYVVKEGMNQIEFLPLPLVDEFRGVGILKRYYIHKTGNKKQLNAAINEVLKYINILMYLVSDKGDVAENPKQKTITRRTGTVKNIFREVRKWDVGYRFGSVFRKQKTMSEEDKVGTDISRTGVSTGLGIKKRAHIRRGHWHSFWTGKRDGEERKQIIKWISPIAINFEKNSPAVIHKVKQ